MKNLKERWKRAAAIGLAAILLTAQLPVTAFAEEAVMQETAAEPVITQEMTAASEAPEQPEDKAASEAPEQTENETAPEQPETGTGDEAPVEAALPDEPSTPPEAADNGSGDEAEKQEAPESVKTPAFQESRSLDGVKITVEAEEGVFPEGAVLSVEKVTAAQERKAEEAVEDKRPEEQNVAASYTYDIKVLDKDGKEIQPADESKVKVSFTLEEVADANLTTNVYHIVEEDSQNGGDSGEEAPKEGDNPENSRNEEADAVNSAELTAEKLEVETDGDTAIVETDGFSLYTVEFTYENKQYVLPGDSEVALSEILKAVGLSGEASAVEVSDTSLFSAEKNEGGEWIVTAHKAFSTKEWMKVTIGGVEYEITVTDNDPELTWRGLQEQLSEGGEVTLTNDVTAGSGDIALTIPWGANVTLDLNGHTIDRGLADKDPAENGNVITVKGTLILKDSSTVNTGTLTGGNNEQASGGGVYVEGGEFTMNGGTILDCNVDKFGGGVYVSERGTFTMKNGTISHCTATGDGSVGGGVFVCYNGTFTMSGGTISGCEATNGGGVFVYYNGTFTMSGGTIVSCSAHDNGGGVYVSERGTFTMKNGTISHCTATGDGSVGGGVYVYYNGTFTMENSTITGCTASENGGGVYNEGTFTMSGAPVISGNKKESTSENNVELGSDATITVSGALIHGAEIYVNAGKGDVVATGENYTLQASDADAFHSDRDVRLAAALDSDGKVKFFNPWGVLQARFNNASTVAGSPTRITLTGDVTADTGDSAFLIPADKHVTLDLNGHTIDRGLAGQGVDNNGNVITVSGNLTLTDSSLAHTGTITGGNNEQAFGGGVSVKGGTFTMDGGTISGCNAARGGGVNVDSGTFTMTGGTITGCKAYDHGGGVNVNGGTFTMAGGTITDCNANPLGGGVYVDSGMFTMENGTITGCKANNSGGGVYNHGTFNMSDGTITNCSANNSGGGVYIEDRGTFKVSGTPVISGNMKGSTSANNVELGGKTISVNGALTSGAEIHVNAGKGDVVATGENYTLQASDADAFRSDKDSSLVAAEDSDGKVKFFNPWGALQLKFNSANESSQQPTRIILTGEVTADEGDSALVIPAGKYVTLDLSGNTIDRGLAGQGVGNNGNVITVSGNLTLTDSSSAHTGTITGGNNTGNGGGVYVGKNGTFTMKGGTISGCNVTGDNSKGGGVYVGKNGTFTMTGGTISGCKATRGGGVYVDYLGTFAMRDGTITGCEATRGGGVYVHGNNENSRGKFTMNGGTISGCEAKSGGGVYVSGRGKFNMQGGTITGCESTSGGGVYVSDSGEFTMNGGTISDCIAHSSGGGVHVCASNMEGGTFKVSGAPVISGNKISNTNSANNVELDSGTTITVTGALIPGAKIHVNAGLGVPIAEKGGDRTTALTETEAGYFKCDQDSQYKAGLNENGQVVFKTALPAIANATGLTYNGTEQEPELTFDGVSLTADTDYTVSYKKVDGSTGTALIGAPKHAGDYKAVAAGKGSYAGTSEAVFTIAPKTVTVSSGIAAKDKTYDGTTDAELITTNAVFTGICDGDSLTVSGTGSFEDASAGSDKPVSINQSSLTLGGRSSGNYVLAGSGNQTTATANITKATPAINPIPAASAITYGQTLLGSNLSGGEAKLGNTQHVSGNFEWSNPATRPAVSDSNQTEYTVTFTPDDSNNINTATCKVKLTVSPADIPSEYITAPTAKDDLTYTGQSLQLITAGSVSGNIGTMQYVLGTDVECPVDFTEAIPSAANAGIYHVWYKVKGDDNHNGTTVSGPVAVEIAKADYTNNTVSGNTKYGLAGQVELKDCIAPGGSLGTRIASFSDPDAVLEGEPSLSGTVLSYKFRSLSENVGKKARVTVSVNNAPNYKDYEVTATLNVINCDHANKRLVEGTTREGTCTEPGYEGNYYCPDCGSTLEGKETPIKPDNHNFIMVEVVKPATTITKGETKYRCSRCHAEKIVADIPCVEEEGRDYDDLRKDVEGLSGNAAPVIENGKDENGNDTETVKIGGEEVSKTVTDKDTGKETIVSKVWIGGLKDSYCYTGSAIKPAFHVYDGTMQLKEKTDYTVSYKNNKDAGTATVEIKFKGNYKDTKAETLSFTISKAELGKDIIAHEVGVAQKKSAQKPVPVLTWADTGKAVSSKYFDFSYSPDPVKAAGEYTATITPKSGSGSKNYGGSTTAKIVVTTKDKLLSNAKVTFDKKSYAYTGSAVTPKYSLKLDGRTLTENTDYKLIDICNNTAPGTATVMFEGTGSYAGTKSATFKISGKIELKDSSDFTFSYDASVPFVKGGAKPAVSVRDNRNKVNLKEGKDYTVSYSKNKSITGTPEIKIKGKGNYKGTINRAFTITQQDVSKLTITAADQFVKSSKLKKATVTIYDTDGNKLSSGKDFIVGDNGTPVGDENTGTVTVSVTGAGNYTGQAPVTFRYMDSSTNIGKAGTKKIADQSYTGNAVKLSYADLTNVLYTGSKSAPTYLIPGTDFEIVSYSNNTKRGTAKVVLKGRGSYAGTKTLTFKIVRRKVDYTGKI